jgi:plasmid stability protein
MEPPPDEATMPVNLSIKNVPDELAEQLRRRARQSHRSLQGELMAILEASVHDPVPLTPLEVLEIVRGLGMTTEEDSVEMIRQDRDGR